MSNLFSKASIVLTPTAYSTDRILSVKPLQIGLDNLSPPIDFNEVNFESNPTSGTVVNSPSGTLTFTNASSNGANVQLKNRLIVVGTTYKIKFTVSNYTSGTFRMSVGNQITSVVSENGSFVFYVTYESGLNRNYFYTNSSTLTVSNISVTEASDGDLDFIRATSATRVNSNKTIETVGENIPRIDFLNSSSDGHWLLEKEKTNEVTYSQDIGSISGLSAIGTTIVTNNTFSPAGLTDVSLLQEDSSLGSHFAFKDFELTNPATYSISIFAKSNRGRNLRFGDGGVGWSSGFTANFDLTAGTSDAGTIEDYGNGWFRCSVQGTVNASKSRLIIYSTSGSITSYQGNGESGVYLYGFQIEEGEFVSSYIPTSGSTVTRNTDVAKSAGNDSLINSTEGVLYAEIAAFEAAPGTQKQFSLSDGTNSNAVRFSYRSTENQIQMIVRSEGSNTANMLTVLPTVTTFIKVALKYKTDDCALFVNAIKTNTDTSATMPIGLSSFQFNRGDGGNIFEGKVKCIAIFKEALTDSELECLTSI
tara:strand:- start:714 stop:2312 length:1599 start_codon:yes stop_codon:yes gene_type:complete